MSDNKPNNLWNNIKYINTVENLKMQVENLLNEYEKKQIINPIYSHSGRVKSITSIIGKLAKKKVKAQKLNLETESDYEFTPENIDNQLNDIAGYRIICPFLSDVYQVADDIEKNLALEIIATKNYIEFPKSNGYTGYHMKVKVPTNNEFVKGEIQVKTLIQDAIASLDHKICYKKDVKLSKEMREILLGIIKYCNYLDKDLDRVLRTKISQSSYQNIISPLLIKDISTFIEMHKPPLEIMKQKINKIISSYNDTPENNPIDHIKERIKTQSKIIEKLQRKNLEVNFLNVKEHIHDIAGITIVCSFLDDVNEVIRRIKEDDTLVICKEQDYMLNPKENGYAGYHMQIMVPVPTNKGVIYQEVELIIRTKFQEVWSILEERLSYKKQVDKSIIDELKRSADNLQRADFNMNEIARFSRKTQQENKTNIKRKELTRY